MQMSVSKIEYYTGVPTQNRETRKEIEDLKIAKVELKYRFFTRENIVFRKTCIFIR